MLSYLNSNLALTPGYLNPALNNSALVRLLTENVKNFLASKIRNSATPF